MSKQETILRNDDAIDRLEAVMISNFPKAECPVGHKFFPGGYVREIFMPAGTAITSKIHATTHPFFVLMGSAEVLIGDKWEFITAPYNGITLAGTRRVLRILEDSVWCTVHLTNKMTVEEVEEDIIEKHENQYLSPEIEDSHANEL